MKLWREWGVVRRSLFVTAAALLLYAVQQVWLGLAEAESQVTRFTSEKTTMIELDAGERRSVYLTPEESGVFNFDFYPSDLQCLMEGPNGTLASGLEIHDERRWVDGSRRHWGVESFQASEAGTYELTCTDSMGRRYPLVLASPGRFGRFSPQMAVFALVVATAILAVALMIVGHKRRGPDVAS